MHEKAEQYDLKMHISTNILSLEKKRYSKSKNERQFMYGTDHSIHNKHVEASENYIRLFLMYVGKKGHWYTHDVIIIILKWRL